MPFVSVAGHRLEYERIDVGGRDRPTLVLLHEGLGSIAMWRDFPGRLAHATGCNAIVYSRYGYGNSDPLARSRDVRYMHDEALVALSDLLNRLEIERPLLVGHSDGASIALIHAGAADRPVLGVVAMAPHVIVEDISVASIAAARDAYATTDLRARLSRYHADVDGACRGFAVRCSRSRARTTNTERWSNCSESPPRRRTSSSSSWGTAGIRRIATSPRRCLMPCRASSIG